MGDKRSELTYQPNAKWANVSKPFDSKGGEDVEIRSCSTETSKMCVIFLSLHSFCAEVTYDCRSQCIVDGDVHHESLATMLTPTRRNDITPHACNGDFTVCLQAGACAPRTDQIPHLVVSGYVPSPIA